MYWRIVYNRYFLLDSKSSFENTQCNCTKKHGYPPWCSTLHGSIKSICILDGGLKARPCPGAKRLEFGGKTHNDYFSSDPSVCKKAERKCYSSSIIIS